MNHPVQIQDLRRPTAVQTVQPEPDYGVDLFSVRGFKLAHRIAEVFASSDAVPAIFRSHNLKKGRGDSPDVWVENVSAIGNCVVAIETARAVGMSITSVMQHANIIEGRLSWSAQFVIAAINASHRFTPLRFDIKSRGVIKANYREKGGWDKAKGGFTFTEKTVELEDLVCVAWALPIGIPLPKGVYTLQQCRDAGLPIIESAPVSMKMAVEEGWYSKPGSKWQTEMRHQMLQYRAGAFFGRIHAPDVVMGMGRTTEELQDVTTVEVAPDGRVKSMTTEELRRSEIPTPRADVVTEGATTVVSESSADSVEPAGDEPPRPAAANQTDEPPAQQATAADWTPTPEEQAQIRARELAEAGVQSAQSPAPAARRARPVQTAME